MMADLGSDRRLPIFKSPYGLPSTTDPIAEIRTCCSAKSSSNRVTVANFITENTAYNAAGQTLRGNVDR